MPPRKKKPAPVPRVPPDVRRRQLIEEANLILKEEGLERLQVSALAERAGVSRPLVYRLFPTRYALMRAILEDFTEAIDKRFHQALVRALPAASIESITTAFIEASCDIIEDKGAGPWLLLDARGNDPQIERIGRETFSALLEPWQDQLAAFTGTNAKRAANDLGIIVAAGRAALFGWIDGAISRQEAVEDATRAVSALVDAFRSRPPAPSPTKKRSR
ncbi:MAG: TetR/AcrR family transcriptional regulator [Sandaracinaceae bacterium]